MLELQWGMKENLCLSDFNTVLGENGQQTSRKRRRKVGRQMVRDGVSGGEEEERNRFRERCFLEKQSHKIEVVLQHGVTTLASSQGRTL